MPIVILLLFLILIVLVVALLPGLVAAAFSPFLFAAGAIGVILEPVADFLEPVADFVFGTVLPWLFVVLLFPTFVAGFALLIWNAAFVGDDDPPTEWSKNKRNTLATVFAVAAVFWWWTIFVSPGGGV